MRESNVPSFARKVFETKLPIFVVNGQILETADCDGVVAVRGGGVVASGIAVVVDGTSGVGGGSGGGERSTSDISPRPFPDGQ